MAVLRPSPRPGVPSTGPSVPAAPEEGAVYLCGRFTVTASDVDEPDGSESGSGAAAIALREAIAGAPELLPASGWVATVKSDGDVLFLARGRGAATPYLFVEVADTSTAWSVNGFGDCAPGLPPAVWDSSSRPLWWSLGARPERTTTTLDLLVQSDYCHAAYLGPVVAYGSTTVTVSFWERLLPEPPGGWPDACTVGLSYKPYSLTLLQPLDDRTLLDGSTFPAGPAQGLPSPTPSPTAASAWKWRSYSWEAATFEKMPPMPWFGMPVPGHGYIGGCDNHLSHAEWAYMGFGYPYCSSSDGLHWSVSKDPVFKGMFVSGVAKGSDGYVMVGGVVATGKAAVFRSSDAVHWARLPDATVPQKDLSLTFEGGTTIHGPASMGGLAWGPAGYVAVGWNVDLYMAPHQPAVVWRSTDGVKWTVQDSPGEGFSFIFSAGSRYFLSASPPDSAPGLELWYSADAVTWHKAVTQPPGDTGFSVNQVSGTGANLTAGARANTGGDYSFSSTDGGASWHGQSALPECAGTQVLLRGKEYSYDDGATWQTAEVYGPPDVGGCLQVSLGDAVFSYHTNPVADSDQLVGLTWIGEP